ncbi:unnamed protein product [Mytilus coruscus]|uniref:Uncharacterized protein n=1 Tax=Mytilus coruscus TaxID=42192 RepID=A0A6J8AGQ1_MYTCO|nr:unnamed protein product [Mytilus coruscus]
MYRNNTKSEEFRNEHFKKLSVMLCLYYSIAEDFTESADVIMYPASPAYADLNQPFTLMCKTNVTDLWKSTSIYDETNSNGVPNVLYFEKAVDGTCRISISDSNVYNTSCGLTTGEFNVTLLSVERKYHMRYIRCSVKFSDGASKLIENANTVISIKAPPSSNTILITANPTGPINSGETIHVTCSLSGGNPLATLSWNCSGTTINKSSEKSAFLDIAFTVGQQDDGKICTCFATHLIASYNATAEKVVKLKVYYRPDDSPTITQVPEGSIDTGDAVLLNCTLNGGNPVVTLSWNCSGNNHVSKSGNTVVSTIEFNVNRSYHHTVCTCLASQDTIDSYSDSASHMLNVIYPPEGHPTIQQTIPGPVDSGSFVSLIYSLSGGNPLASLTWDCKGITQNSSSSTKTEYIVTFTVNKNFNGRVCTCSAIHPIDSYRPNARHQLVVFYASGEPQLRLGEEFPWFEGNTGTVNCLADVGNPESVYQWMIDVQKQMQNKSLLQIKPLLRARNDQEIKCSVNNNYTLRNNITLQPALLKLNVEYSPEIKFDRFPVYVVEGENTTITCNTRGNPLPHTQWFINGIEMTQPHQNQSALYLTDIDRLDQESNYTCKATSNSSKYDILTSDKDLSIVVFSIATAPVHINILCNTKSLYVLWVSEFNGGREQTFFVEYWMSLQKSNITRSGPLMDLGEPKTIQYVVKGLLPGTNYSVRILASNAKGISVSETAECITDLEIKTNNIKLEGNNGLVHAGIAMLSVGATLIVVISLAFLIRCRRNAKQSLKSSNNDISNQHSNGSLESNRQNEVEETTTER